MFAFDFEAAATRRTKLRLVYRRPWKKNRPPAQSFTVSVTIESGV